MSNTITVELFYDSAWNDVTSYVLVRNLIQITRGLADEAVRADPQTLALTFNNADGRFSPRNPLSPLYGKIGRNTRIRVTCNGSVRFVGEVVAWPPRWNLPGTDAWVPIEAAGITRRLGQAGSLRSPMYRTHSGVSANDLVPAHYMPLEDGSDATFFAEVMNGTAVAVPSAVTPAADDTLAGSLPLPQFASGAHLSVVVPPYSPTTQWDLQFTVKMPDAKPTSNVTLWEGAVSNAGGGVASMRLIIDITDALIDTVLSLQALDGSGAVVAAVGKSIDPLASISPEDFYGSWRSIIVGMHPTGASYDIALALTETDITFNGYFNIPTSGSVGVLRSYTLRNTGTQTVVFGHAALFAGSFDINTEATQNASSMLGHAGELASDRISRLCQEEQIPVTVSGTSTTAMGPQSVGTLLELLDDCATVDAGILYEPRDSLGLAYRTRSSRYNQAVDLALDYAAGYVSSPLDPIEDDQGVVNDLTIARDGGSSARYELTTGRMSTQDPPDGIGRVALSETHNLYSDDQCIHHASWMVNVSAVDEERYPAITVDLTSADLAGASTIVTNAAALDVGDRITIDNLPSWQPNQSADQVALGYDETIGHVEWKLRFHGSPASPYSVGVYGSDATVSRYGSAISTLSAAITSSQTSVSVDSGGDTWVTGSAAPTFPLDVKIGGITYACSAISGSSPTYTFTITRLATDRAHAAGTPVEVADVGRYAL